MVKNQLRKWDLDRVELGSSFLVKVVELNLEKIEPRRFRCEGILTSKNHGVLSNQRNIGEWFVLRVCETSNKRFLKNVRINGEVLIEGKIPREKRSLAAGLIGWMLADWRKINAHRSMQMSSPIFRFKKKTRRPRSWTKFFLSKKMSEKSFGVFFQFFFPKFEKLFLSFSTTEIPYLLTGVIYTVTLIFSNEREFQKELK